MQPRWRLARIAVLIIPYLLYAIFVIRVDQGPVDYETFMDIGERLRHGQPIYGENSYYPLPYVMIFSIFSALPRPISMAAWLLLPVVAALAISGWQSSILLFAPVLSHFLGGQTALLGLLGLWGYRRWYADPAGGFWLALTTIKPQLAVVPCLWAAFIWGRMSLAQRRIPIQALAFIATVGLLYLPSLLIIPDWPSQWLSIPRPLFERALSGLIPRTLLILFSETTPIFWLVWLVSSIVLVLVIWRYALRLTLDMAILLGFVISPLVHDYDLIQIVPLLETQRLRRLAVLLSLPGILVIALAYSNDGAWYAFTVIAPGLLLEVLNASRMSPRRGNGSAELVNG